MARENTEENDHETLAKEIRFMTCAMNGFSPDRRCGDRRGFSMSKDQELDLAAFEHLSQLLSVGNPDAPAVAVTGLIGGNSAVELYVFTTGAGNGASNEDSASPVVEEVTNFEDVKASDFEDAHGPDRPPLSLSDLVRMCVAGLRLTLSGDLAEAEYITWYYTVGREKFKQRLNLLGSIWGKTPPDEPGGPATLTLLKEMQECSGEGINSTLGTVTFFRGTKAWEIVRRCDPGGLFQPDDPGSGIMLVSTDVDAETGPKWLKFIANALERIVEFSNKDTGEDDLESERLEMTILVHALRMLTLSPGIKSLFNVCKVPSLVHGKAKGRGGEKVKVADPGGGVAGEERRGDHTGTAGDTEGNTADDAEDEEVAEAPEDDESASLRDLYIYQKPIPFTRFLQTLACWIISTRYFLNGRATRLIRRGAFKAKIVRVPQVNAVKDRFQNLAIRERMEKRLLDWARYGLVSEISDTERERVRLLTKARKDIGSVHCEASLMSLVLSDDCPVPQLTEAVILMADRTSFLPVGVGSKCCWTCFTLARILNTYDTKPRFALGATHDTIFAWAPPPGLPVETLRRLRDELYDEWFEYCLERAFPRGTSAWVEDADIDSDFHWDFKPLQKDIDDL